MNQQVMMKKLMKMKEEMEKTQQEIAESEYEVSVGGIVTVTCLGTKEVTEIKISEDFEASTPEDLELLSDSIVAACKQLYKEIDEETDEKMEKYKALLGFGF